MTKHTHTNLTNHSIHNTNVIDHESWFAENQDKIFAYLEAQSQQPNWQQLRDFNQAVLSEDTSRLIALLNNEMDDFTTSRAFSSLQNAPKILFAVHRHVGMRMVNLASAGASTMQPWDEDLEKYVRELVRELAGNVTLDHAGVCKLAIEAYSDKKLAEVA